MSIGRPSRFIMLLAPMLLGIAALANCGCLLIAAGGAAGAATGIAYLNGKVSATYFAFPNDVWAATRQGLTELGMPLVKESFDGFKGSIESKTAENDKVYITLECVSPPGLVDGAFTRLSIRIASFGDRDGSERIFQQIGGHLPAPGFPPSSAPFAGVTGPGVVPVNAGAKPLTATNYIVPQPATNPLGSVSREPPLAGASPAPAPPQAPVDPAAWSGPNKLQLPSTPIPADQARGSGAQ
jgi:Protein of unknown function (DUF3568)